jgi:hypothetical protein
VSAETLWLNINYALSLLYLIGLLNIALIFICKTGIHLGTNRTYFDVSPLAVLILAFRFDLFCSLLGIGDSNNYKEARIIEYNSVHSFSNIILP